MLVLDAWRHSKVKDMLLRSRIVKSVLVCLITLHGLCAAADEWVTLQNNSGQSIRVKLLRMQGNSVHIEMAGGRSMKTPLSVYNEASQSLIRQHFYQLLLVPENFECKLSEVRLPGKNKRLNSEGSIEITESKRAYSIGLSSRISESLHDIRLEYLIFHFVDAIGGEKRSEGSVKRIKGKLNLAVLEGYSNQKLQTEPVEFRETRLMPGWVWSKGSGARDSKDRLDGIWIKLFVGDQLVLQQSRPASLASKEAW
jgi:hypothetical protein